MYGVTAARRGRPVQMVDRMVLSNPASIRLRVGCQRSHPHMSIALATHTFLDALVAPDSTAATNLVPTQTAEAPYIKDAAIPRPVIKSQDMNEGENLASGSRRSRAILPSKIPPAATSVTGSRVNGDTYCLTRSAQAGTRTLHTSAVSSVRHIALSWSTHLVGISPVCPPASDPWAQMISAPAAHALTTCFG